MVRRRRVARTEGGGRDPRALPRNTWSPVSSCHFSAMLRARCSRSSRLDSSRLDSVLLAAMDEDDLDLRLRVNSAREENLSDRSDNRAPLRVRASSPASELAATKAREGAGLHGMDTAAAATTGELASPASSVGQEGARPSSPRSQGLPRSLQIPSTSARTITQANPYPFNQKKKGASFSPRRRRRGETGEGGGASWLVVRVGLGSEDHRSDPIA